MLSTPRRRSPSPPQRLVVSGGGRDGGGGDEGCDYEKVRQERIKENMERMQKLGIFDLSLNLKHHQSNSRPTTPNPKRRRNPSNGNGNLQPSPSPRRSFRLQNVKPVVYAEVHVKRKAVNKMIRRPILMVEGKREEFYTEEHDKLLGTCETNWVLFVDGCGKDGKRIYDQIMGKTCHQCRQKTLGHRTYCNKCNMLQGQFCGDCLYMRYGENVLEAQKNPDWTCPVCRGICNCSFCRLKKGWAPTGSLYRRVVNLGFRSVAHYLIQTRRHQTNSGDQDSEKSCLEEPLAIIGVESNEITESPGSNEQPLAIIGVESNEITESPGSNEHDASEGTGSDESNGKTESPDSDEHDVSKAVVESITKLGEGSPRREEAGTGGDESNWKTESPDSDKHDVSKAVEESITKLGEGSPRREADAIARMEPDSVARRLILRKRLSKA